MSPVFLLAVGQDPIVLSTRCSILRSAGYMVAEAFSIAESIELFKDADFDLVLLCHSIPVQDRDKLTRAMRSSGSRIPIYAVAPLSGGFTPGSADGIISSRPENLKKELWTALQIAPPEKAPQRAKNNGI
jgi:hypothetical protein